MIPCSAKIVDRREVISSNGDMEYRFVIRSDIAIGDRRWPVEMTLTDRGQMAYRMLIGRQALTPDMIVSPLDSFLQPTLGYEIYSSAAVRTDAPRRSLRIAVLSREESAYSTLRIVEEGEARGHVVEVLDTTRLYMAITTAEPAVFYDGKRLARYDAVIPRIGVSVTSYGTAILRQFEAMGTFVLNPADGIMASRDKLHAHQLLARHRLPMPTTAVASSPRDTEDLIELGGGAPLVLKLLESTQGKGVVLAETSKAAASVITAFRGLKAEFLVQEFVKEAAGEDVRALVIGGKVVAAMRRTARAGEFRSNLHLGGTAEAVKLKPAERDIATRAARAFRLGLAGVDMLRSAHGPKILEVNSSPGFEGIEAATDRNIAELVYLEIERRVRPAPARRKKS